jgi:hypothetical protein
VGHLENLVTFRSGVSFGMDGVKRRIVGKRKEEDESECAAGVSKELLRGIPDEVVIDHIAPKLPWKALHILCLVSHAWLRAIRSHHVHRARVRSKSAETLVLIEYEPSADGKGIALYSMTDDNFRELPCLPEVDWRPSRLSGWQCYNGKVYGTTASNIYVLDLAGQQASWKECRAVESSDMAERVVETRNRSEHGVEFMAKGKLYLMNSTGVQHRSADGSSWTQMHTHSFPALGPVDSLSITPFDVLFVENELLATVGWHNRRKRRWGEWLFRSKDLGGGNEHIVWHRAGIPLSSTSVSPSYVSFRIHPIQL